MSSQHPLVHPSSGGLSTRRSARKGTVEHNRCGWVRIPCFEHRNRGRGIDRRARSRGAGGRSLRPSVLRARESRAGLRARVLGVLRVEAASSGACGDSRLRVAARWKSVAQHRTTLKHLRAVRARSTLACIGRGPPLRFDDVFGGAVARWRNQLGIAVPANTSARAVFRALDRTFPVLRQRRGRW